MSIYKGVGVYFLVLVCGVAQRLVIGFVVRLQVEVAAHHSIQQYRYASTLTSLSDIACQVSIKRAARVCMAVGLRFLVVVAELYEHVVARLYER